MTDNSSHEVVGSPDRTVRLSVLINGDTNNALQTLMAVDGVNATEIVRRSIGVYNFLKEQDFLGRVVTVETSDGRKEKLVFPEE